MNAKNEKMDRQFFWRRIHSLLGLWLVIFLIEHMVTNSQSALLIGDNGAGFVRAVNFLKNLPYLPAIEIGLLAIPIVMHAFWGVRYLFTSKMNHRAGSGEKPAMPEFGRNRAFAWQRITSWILLFGLAAHVGYMRFYRYPVVFDEGVNKSYFVRVSDDPGLPTVADRLGVKLFNAQQIATIQGQLDEDDFSDLTGVELQQEEMKQEWVKDLSSKKLGSGQVMAMAPDFGTATLLTVRDAFSSPIESALYTIFVLAAVFHAFNGLWTFMITWGIVLKMRSQKRAVNVCYGIMALIAFLGLASVWGTYWINLKN